MSRRTTQCITGNLEGRAIEGGYVQAPADIDSALRGSKDVSKKGFQPPAMLGVEKVSRKGEYDIQGEVSSTEKVTSNINPEQ